MAAHELVWDKQDHCCRVCGARYHCGSCNEGSGMMGHYVSTGKGGFFSCAEPEKYAEWKERNRLERELRDRVELRLLKARYEKDE